MKLAISTYCTIKQQKVLVNGKEHPIEVTDNFIKDVYKSLGKRYPKFFKMDNLSKLAFVTAELTLNNRELATDYAPEKIGIYLANKASSLDTDREHQKSITNREDYFPSPAVFVYTLPNICIGEIAIKQQIKGPNSFFIFDKFDAQFFAQYISNQFALNKIEAGLFGWVNWDAGNYDSALFLVEKSGEGKELTAENLSTIYNT